MKIGYDPKSLGLIKYDTTNTDPKYTAVSSNGNVNKYIIHPKYFNEDDVSFLEDKVNGRIRDTQVYVGVIQLKDYITHGIFETDLYQDCDVKLINNPFTGSSPKSYADLLVSGETEVFAPHHLNYGTTIQPISIDIRELPNIELNADTTVTVNIGDLSFTRSLQHLLREDTSDPILTVNPGNQRVNGFEFYGKFAEIQFNSVYEKTFTQTAVVDGKTEHMIKNKNKEQALINSQIYNFATNTLGSLTDGFDILGGIGSALDAYLEYGLREAGFADMEKQSNNIGGNIYHDAIGETIENLVSITYPIKKHYVLENSPTHYSDIYPGEYEVNSPKTFNVNRRFYNMREFLRFVEQNYKGTLVSGNVTPIVNYGEYTNYFQRIIELGGLQ